MQRGRADLTFEGVPGDRLDELRTRYAAQLHVTPTTAIFVSRAEHEAAALRRRVRPPGGGLRGRPPRLVDDFGGSDVAAPTCQLLPPNFPAYRRYCPYTARPTEDGAWTAPDLERARKLVAESGTKGMRVDVLGVAGEDSASGALTALTTVLDRTLRQLGYRTSVRRLPDVGSYFYAVDARAPRVEAALMAWFPDYPSPANMLDVPPCSNFPSWCDPAVDRKIRETLELQTRDPQAANEAWARLERELVDQAIVVPVVNLNAIDFVSKRLGNYQRHPVFGMLISQVWVR